MAIALLHCYYGSYKQTNSYNKTFPKNCIYPVVTFLLSSLLSFLIRSAMMMSQSKMTRGQARLLDVCHPVFIHHLTQHSSLLMEICF